MKTEKHLAIASFILSLLAFIVSISCAIFQPEIIETCDPPTYLTADEMNPDLDQVSLKDGES